MSLLENLDALEQPKAERKQCVVSRLIVDSGATDTERNKIDGLLWPATGDVKVPTTHLARALRKSNIPVSDKSLERHRTRDCVCYRLGVNE